MINEIKIVIGSWGSYNECNERALGSKWLDLSIYSNWEEIEEELKTQGFELDGIDEELFIQDIEGFDTSSINCDCMHPQTLFEIIKESEVLEDDYKFDIMEALLEVRNFDDFEDRVKERGCRWSDDINLYKNMDWSDYGKDYLSCCCISIPDIVENFIDFEAFGKYIGYDWAEEYSNGIIEIIN